MSPDTAAVLLMFETLSRAKEEEAIDIDFLMPNGILIPLRVHFYISLSEVKKLLWVEAKKYPLYSLLKDPSYYTLLCINKDCVKEEIVDESLNMFELQPLILVMSVIERKTDEAEHSLNKQLKSLLGKATFSVSHDKSVPDAAEVNDFETKMLVFAENEVRFRKWKENESLDAKLKYLYPPSLRRTSKLPDHLRPVLSENISAFAITIVLANMEASYTIQVPLETYPKELIETLFVKRQRKGSVMPDAHDYILKVCGQDDFLYGDFSLQQFKYICDCVIKREKPKVILLLKSDILSSENQPPVPPRVNPVNIFDTTPTQGISLWSIDQDVQITVDSVFNINNADGLKAKLYVGLYYGNNELCQVLCTDEQTIAEGKADFFAKLKFALKVKDIPANTRVCCALKSRQKNKKDLPMYAWVNFPMFDYQNRLRRGVKTLFAWTVSDEMHFDDDCYSIGSIAQNPDELCTKVVLNFSSYGKHTHIVHPTNAEVLNLANSQHENPQTPGLGRGHGNKMYLHHLKNILDKDPLDELPENDKTLVWALRYEVRDRYPNSLPKLLTSVKWHCRNDVAEMHYLFNDWTEVKTEVAIELLDFKYPEKAVRDFAVNCLDKSFTDDDVSLYMLQLIQALKYETYLLCSLVRLLLSRALHNQRLGHQFFWLLKAELSDSFVAQRHGLILEIYCKSCEDHVPLLIRQSVALHKLFCVNALIKNSQKNIHVQMTDYMRQILQGKGYSKALSNLQCPLSPILKLTHLCVEKCKFMGSKKRPLCLVWDNEEDAAKKVSVLYKHGDDLRQDMLTLQIISIMDSLWQEANLDLRMTPYHCLATAKEEGMIQFVCNSITIADILEKYAGTFNKESIYLWLREKNPTKIEMDSAIEEFTLSCAGYCVATYVLGIGDRHCDNIMVKETGQLFHIDFGHFLGNFKIKFRIRRERVPFILTQHFVHVITDGNQSPGNFERFRSKCEEAYIVLRRNYNLLISLFMLMLPTGIPELSHAADIDYLRTTLALTMTENDARLDFRKKLNDALRKSYWTTIDWKCHMINKNRAT